MSEKSQNSNPDLPKSRWSRPNIYVMIPCIFMLFLGIFGLSFSVYYFFYNPTASTDHRFAQLAGDFMVLIIIILSIPSILSGIKLFQLKKSGIYVSLVVLIPFFLISLGMFDPTYFTWLDFFGIGLTTVMFSLFGISWKHVTWR